jgi:PncC family amidohydrolase
VLDALVAVGATVAVAESLTGGLLTAALTEPAGASKAVRGGLVVYATDLKATLAGVPVPLLHAEGAVSPDVAGALAAGARDRLGATYGLGVTGVAGPDPSGTSLSRVTGTRSALPPWTPPWPSCWPPCGRGPRNCRRDYSVSL